MPDLLAARSQMAVSLAFHIVFAVIGIAMPVLMVLAERRWQRTCDPVYLDLAKRWARGTAVVFAVGAASGPVLSFGLGLLWPRCMELAGPIIGMPMIGPASSMKRGHNRPSPKERTGPEAAPTANTTAVPRAQRLARSR